MTLEFFNTLSGKLEIELSEPAERISEKLYNKAASPTARVTKVALEMQVYEDDDFRALTDEEWSRVAFEEPTIRIRGSGEIVVEHAAPNGVAFTVRDLAAAVERTELENRTKTEWFGGVDVHHVFFEGIHLEEDGVYEIHWGS